MRTPNKKDKNYCLGCSQSDSAKTISKKEKHEKINHLIWLSPDNATPIAGEIELNYDKKEHCTIMPKKIYINGFQYTLTNRERWNN